MTTRTTRFIVEATPGKTHSLVMLPDRPIGVYNASSSPYIKDVMVTEGRVAIYAEVGEGKDERKNVARNFVILGATEPPQGSTYITSVTLDVDKNGFAWIRKVYELSDGPVTEEPDTDQLFDVNVIDWTKSEVVVENERVDRVELESLMVKHTNLRSVRREDAVKEALASGLYTHTSHGDYTLDFKDSNTSWLHTRFQITVPPRDDISKVFKPEPEPEPRYTVTVSGYKTDLVIVDDVEMSREEMIDLTSLICELDKTNLNLVLQILDETNQMAVASKKENCTRYFVKVTKLNAQQTRKG